MNSRIEVKKDVWNSNISRMAVYRKVTVLRDKSPNGRSTGGAKERWTCLGFLQNIIK